MQLEGNSTYSASSPFLPQCASQRDFLTAISTTCFLRCTSNPGKVQRKHELEGRQDVTGTGANSRMAQGCSDMVKSVAVVAENVVDHVLCLGATLFCRAGKHVCRACLGAAGGCGAMAVQHGIFEGLSPCVPSRQLPSSSCHMFDAAAFPYKLRPPTSKVSLSSSCAVIIT